MNLSSALDLPKSIPETLLSFGLKETAEFQRQSVELSEIGARDGVKTELMPLSRDHYAILDELAYDNGKILEWILRRC